MANFGKLMKHKYLTKSSELVPFIPITKKMSKQSFHSLFKQFGHIVVKPSKGSGGAGVMQVDAIGNGKVKVQYGKIIKTFRGIQAAYKFIQNKVDRVYVVQQKINLARINGRPFDLRVMVQKKKGSDWRVTGILAKIAGQGYFITNLVRSKGKALPLKLAIRKSNVRRVPVVLIQTRVYQLAIKVVKRLEKHYRINTVGIDMGVDVNGKVWIIEANVAPDKTYFLRLKDKTMYRRIMYYYNNRPRLHLKMKRVRTRKKPA